MPFHSSSIDRQTAEEHDAGGFTLIEVAFTLGVLLTAILASASAFTVSYQLSSQTDSRRVALEAEASVLEDMRAYSASVRLAPEGWSTAMTTAYSPGGAFGSTFPLEGIDATDGVPPTLTVEFVTDETAPMPTSARVLGCRETWTTTGS